MNKILIVFIGFLLFSCNLEKKEASKKEVHVEETAIKIENFDWLLGKWKRVNEKEQKQTFENWEKISIHKYFGKGFTLQNGDTISYENISLIHSKGIWNLNVSMANDSIPVNFLLTEYSSGSFICMNQEHDFPKQIKYWKVDEKLMALVSGGDLEISFEFERIN